MGGCDTVTFRSVTPEVFECMKNKLAEKGINVPPGNEGEMEGFGVKGHFKWDGTDNLTLTITDKPFFIPCGTVLGQIKEFVHNCGGVSLLTVG